MIGKCLIEYNILTISERCIIGVSTVEEQLHIKEELRTLLFLVRNKENFRKVCACGRVYSAEEWLTLPLIGYQTHIWCCELRNCRCSSTIMVVTRKEPLQRVVAKSLSYSPVDTEVEKDGFKTPFTLEECERLLHVYKSTHLGIPIEEWNDDQLWDAARHLKIPGWKQENGVYRAA